MSLDAIPCFRIPPESIEFLVTIRFLRIPRGAMVRSIGDHEGLVFIPCLRVPPETIVILVAIQETGREWQLALALFSRICRPPVLCSDRLSLTGCARCREAKWTCTQYAAGAG